MALREPLPELFQRSKFMTLDFSQIPADTPAVENIQMFFAEREQAGINPRLPEVRQQFNDRMPTATGMRYLVSRYGEDRAAMLKGSRIGIEGRTLHMGIDAFSSDLEPVLAPCDGEVVRAAHDGVESSYGNYVILKPDETGPDMPNYMFFGHLGGGLSALGRVVAGDQIGTIGDHRGNENGGWSRHLHLQMLAELPPEGQVPIGYSTRAAFPENSRRFPDPMQFFPNWHIA